MTWSIAIKTVGSRAHNNGAPAPSKCGSDGSDDNSSGSGGPAAAVAASAAPTTASTIVNDGGESNFTIQVDPDDPLHSLHEKIEEATGLRAEQQRLIYRGRIINSGGGERNQSRVSGGGPTEVEALLGETGLVSPQSSNGNNNAATARWSGGSSTPRVRDVNGLCDQQTIHLVPRLNNTNASNANSTNSGGSNTNAGGGLSGILGGALRDAAGGGGGGTGAATTANVTSLSGEAGMSLLAALLGVSSAGGSGGGGGGAEVASRGGSGSSAVGGSTEGLGGIVERAVMMGVLDDDDATDTAGTGRAPTLLSLGGNSNSTATNNNREADTFPRLAPLGAAARRTARRGRSQASVAAARARASAARLTEADARAPDPGSGEPVRQGLMTLHTLLGNAMEGGETMGRRIDPSPVRAPLDSRRRWYRGQWLDALDTVNQWLEATVVDIVTPSDILPDYEFKDGEEEGDGIDSASSCGRNAGRRTRCAMPDAVVSANDLEGRRRLLLEPLPDSDDDDDDSNDDRPCRHRGGEGGATPPPRPHRRSLPDGRLRPRPDNSPALQLLLIHYNGWPHRWDEWIRSDSERLRPFRTRTRHRPGAGAGSHACPMPTSLFPASPSTAIVRDDREGGEGGVTGGGEEDNDQGMERACMLEELERVVGGVYGLLQAATVGGSRREDNNSLGLRLVGRNGGGFDASPTGGWTDDALHLPWRVPLLPGDNDDDTVPPRPDPRAHLDSARLRQLAPLLDRLGRTLADAAPHVAALADSLPPQPRVAPSNIPSIDGAGLNRASSTASQGAGSVVAAEALEEDPIQSLAARASHLYFGIGGEEDDGGDYSRSTPPAHSSASRAVVTGRVEVVEEQTTSITDPDLTDYIDGMVNTSRGGTGGRGGSSDRDGNRGRDGGSGSDSIGSSLLASYLSSIAGGGAGGDDSGGIGGGGGSDGGARVVRLGGGGGGLGGGANVGGVGGGPGIDIHIHAIVTGPGMAGAVGGGGGGLGGLIVDGGDLIATAAGDGVSTNEDAIPPGVDHRSAAFGLAGIGGGDGEEGDDADLFSELYSESPAPVNLHGEEGARNGVEVETPDEYRSGGGGDLGRLFEECRSIEEEESDAIEDGDDDSAYDRTKEEEGDESVEPTEMEVALSMVDNIPCTEGSNGGAAIAPLSPLRRVDDNAAPAMEGELANTVAAAGVTAIDIDGSSRSSTSLLALSEIESQESSTATAPPPSSSAGGAPAGVPITPTATLSSMQMRGGGGSLRSIGSSSSRPPSLGNRLFRRTFGRLSGSSSRRSGSGSGSGSRST